MRGRCGLLLALVLVLAACTSGSPEQAPSPSPSPPGAQSPATPQPDEDGGSLRFQLRSDPEFIDPGFVLESEGLVVVDALFDSLLATGDDLEIVPAAAAEWDVDGEGRVFTFRLRPGATFHNGEPVTAHDFVRAWNRIVDGTSRDLSPNAHHLAPVAGFEEARASGEPLSGLTAVDDLTLEVVLQYPFHDFPAVVAHPSLAPVPADVERDLAGFRERPVGNGPFAMALPWQHDQFIRVVRFDEYYGDRARLDEVVFQIYGGDADEGRAFADFQEGLLHFAVVPREERDAAAVQFGRSSDGYAGPGLLEGESLILYYFGFNTQRQPFDDPAVRRALSLLIDRAGIADDVMDATRTPATSLVPPAIPGHVPDTCPYCRYAPDEATELLADVELDGLTIAFNAHPVQAAIAEHIKATIEAALEIEVELLEREFDEYLADIRAGDVGFFRLGWEAEYSTQDNFVTTLLWSGSLGDTNVFQFSDPEVDTLIEQARATSDVEERRALYAEAERIGLDRVPLAPVMYYRHSRVVADTVRDMRFKPNGLVDLAQVWLTDHS